MKRLTRDDIQLGQPLPWSVHDRDGRLLMRKGVVIAFEHQIERLIASGLYLGVQEVVPSHRKFEAEEPEPVFDHIGSLTLRLKSLFNALCSQPPAADAPARLTDMAKDIAATCARDADAAIAAANLDFHNPYLLSHHIHSAVLCALIGRRLEVPEKELVSILCAALTYDIGLIDLQYLEKQLEPLDAQQIAAIRRHPLKSVEMLKRVKIHDETWLSAILHHHERADGSGYPDGLAADRIPLGASMLGAMDSYMAMVKSRPFREAKVPLKAIGEIFGGKDDKFSKPVCEALVKELGMYPPGAIVRLANNEIAVVKAKGEKITQPQVYSVFDAAGMPYMAPRHRDAAAEEFAVKSTVAHSECRAVALIMRRLWSN